MITRTSTPEAADFTPKQEGNNNSNISNTSDTSPSSTIAKGPTTALWSRLKDPRIVRVSRAFGGKDRHSKVCTVRGLRDRRVRLSVPTAIQLYDLQDRLGLNQPSKVVDWLLNAAKHEIDELPPLQIPPGSFVPSLQAMLASTHHSTPPPLPPPPPPPQSHKFEGLSLNWNDVPNYWNNNSDKSKEIVREASDSLEERDHDEEGGSSKQDDHDHRVGGGTGGDGGSGAFVLSNNLFQQRSSTNHPPLPGLLNNVLPNTSFLKWDPSNLSLSQFGSYGVMATPQTDHHQDVHNLISHQQLLHMYQSSQTQPYFPNSHGANQGDFDPKQFNFQMLSNFAGSSNNPLASSSLYTMSQTMRPNFHLSVNPKLSPSGDHDNGGNERTKEADLYSPCVRSDAHDHS